MRDEEFERRAGALENENDRSLPSSVSSSDNEEDEMSLDKFQAKVGGQMNKNISSKSYTN